MSAKKDILRNQRVMASSLQPIAPASFALFPKLPEELRCMIWARSAPLRPRVIQLFYESTSKTWHACPDSCGGLPPIKNVSQEARKEALKGYTWAFDTFIDLQEDTIFISDPVFTLRKPQRAFFNTEHARTINKLAISSEVYEGLEEVAAAYPKLCLRFPAVLRKLEGLTHFTLALSDDAVSLASSDNPSDDTEHDSDDGYDTDDGEDGDHEREAEDSIATGPNQTHSGESVTNETHDRSKSQRLARLEELALKTMSRGFVRERGNIHFETARSSADHRDEWVEWLERMAEHYYEEKSAHPDWVRPKVSIMILRYGLKSLGDYDGPIHVAGDYLDTVLEPEIKYSSDSDSMDEFGPFWQEIVGRITARYLDTSLAAPES